MPLRKLGLIVNPVAGMGGAIGLKGTDGPDLVQRAERLGAKPHAQERAARALAALNATHTALEILTYGGAMGEAAARSAGFDPLVIGTGTTPRTTPDDTKAAARLMAARAVDLLLFAGGDGTARDIHDAVGTTLTVLGIPAGVKIQSAVFATSPAAAGRMAASYLDGECDRRREAEVMDIDEEDYRHGVLSARLYGYLAIPESTRLLQHRKAASPPDERAAQQAIAAELVDGMDDRRCYIVGPGTTCRAVLGALGLAKTLLGVDMVRGRELVGRDVGEREILAQIRDNPCSIILTPVGGQGFLLGRGNQQISPAVVREVGRENITVVATAEKLSALQGRPLLVDTGDAATDAYLRGYYRIVTGYRENTMYRVTDFA